MKLNCNLQIIFYPNPLPDPKCGLYPWFHFPLYDFIWI